MGQIQSAEYAGVVLISVF